MGSAMNTITYKRRLRRRKGERGVTLVETVIAAAVLLIGISGVLGLFTVAISQDSAGGDFSTRAAVFAQDKMEQLLALNFNDSSSNTTVYPTAASGGTGLGGVMAGSATVGGINPASPTASYVDYLDAGAQQTTAAGASFMRQWKITTDSTGNVKTITVLTTVVGWNGRGLAPSATLVSATSFTQ
jgi:Tfp pilus assembly protein PilV